MHRKTVFVFGAGASKEANLPTGYELKDRISRLLDIRFDYDHQKSGDYAIVQALRIHVTNSTHNRDINPYLKEARCIKRALPLALSIDNYIDAHRANDKMALCGKLAIVRSILDAERNSLLFFKTDRIDSNIAFGSLDNTWYSLFFQLLTENCGINDLKERFTSVTLIIFNYDRCIEHFVYNALRNYYNISELEAADLIGYITIYHPYGSVGSLPWQHQSVPMEFGGDPEPEQLLQRAYNIKTFTEGTDPNSSDVVEIKKHMIDADIIAFLGFAFHKLNMQLIANDVDAAATTHKCYATTYGISESDKEVIQREIHGLFGIMSGITISMTNQVCSEFFKEFWRSLAFRDVKKRIGFCSFVFLSSIATLTA